MKGTFIALIFISAGVLAQVPQVPSQMEFGGIKLHIDEPARREIQESVDALTANPKYFDVHVQRARSYFPIIERVFREEKIPEDFKYLVLQESALISDAVSSSDAVGFWQFKDFTAMEMGLRVDKTVDERMNIVSSSRAAARYMKKNNERFFNNWIITLMAYQMGPGAAIKAGGEKYKGDRSMTIDRRTYWYIKKFLAHKVAFENFVSGPAELSFVELTNGAGKSLEEIAKEADSDAERIAEYNKWLRKGRIPDDKAYTVVIPVIRGEQPPALKNVAVTNTTKPAPSTAVNNPGRVNSTTRDYNIADPAAFPEFSSRSAANAGKISNINGKQAVIARVNDRVATLAGRGGISVSKFLRYNDMDRGDRVEEGVVYYLKKKRSKPLAHYHVAAADEDLWNISQKYGMKLAKLKQRNRIRSNSNAVREGTILWLRYIRPADVPVEYKIPEQKHSPGKIVAANKPAESASVEEEKVQENKTAAREVEKREWNDSPGTGNTNAQPASEKSLSGATPAERSDDEPTDKKETAHRRITHRVTSGETLYAISKQYDVPVRDILEWNDMNINDPLAIGQELMIRKPVKAIDNAEAENVNEEYYEVKSGDTLYGIARKFNLSLNDLKELNNKTDNSIKPGDKLKVSR